MPLEIIAAEPESDTLDQFTEDVLFTEKGKLTLEAEVLASFLSTVDYTPLFEHADAQQFIQSGPVMVMEGEDETLIPLLAEGGDDDDDDDDEDEAAGFTMLEYMDGAIAAEFIDEDDLLASLEYYLKNEYPSGTLEDRTALQQFADMLTESGEPLEEKFKKSPFKKGDFRKGVMAGVSPASKGAKGKVYNQRVRMMMAMMHKGVIARVPKGTGYKKGDYKRGPGYGGGTPAGKKAYAAASVKDARSAAKITGYVDPGRRKVVKLIFTNIGKSMPKNWIPPEKRGKALKNGKIVVKKVGVKKDTAVAVSKGKMLFGKKPSIKGKSAQLSHDTSAVHTLHEGAGLAGAVMACAARKSKVLTA